MFKVTNYELNLKQDATPPRTLVRGFALKVKKRILGFS